MADKDLNILIQLNDQISQGLSQVSNSLESFNRQIKSVGKDLKDVGQTFAITGAALTGPFALAVANAAQNSAVLNVEINKLKNVTTQLQAEISQAVLPVVQQFVRVVENLFGAFNDLSPALRESLLQGALLTGVFLTVGGVITAIAGKVLVLIANMASLTASFLAFAAANLPLIIILGTIAAIIAAMFKWKAVADIITSTFEVIFRFLMNGFHAIEAAIGKMVEAVLNGLLLIVDGLSKIPGPTQHAFQGMADHIRQAADTAHNFANLELQEVINNTQKISEVIQTGQGEWSQAFDGFKQNVGGAIEWVKNLAKETNNTRSISSINFKQFAADAKSALGQLQSSLQGAAAVNKEFARAAQAVSIAMAIINTAEGVSRAFKDYPWPFSMAVAGIIGAAGAIQIATIAQQKFHSGGMIRPQGLSSDEVPIIAQTGEGVLSRRGMAALGGESSLNLLNSGRRLGASNINNTSNVINVFIESPRISSSQDISQLGEELGFAIDSALRSGRGF